MTILGIETSCDETSAAVVRDGDLLSNITRTQLFHVAYGGVVPELASRAHQQLIIPIVDPVARTGWLCLGFRQRRIRLRRRRGWGSFG